MRILLVRHAIAEASARGGDAERELTREGREKMERGARAIAALVPELELVVTSPYARARQTAEILAAAYPRHLPLVEHGSLACGGKPIEATRAAAAGASHTVALVGHEPDLSRLEGLLLAGHERSLAELKKGGAALIEIDAPPAPGAGILKWHLTPALLRALAD